MLGPIMLVLCAMSALQVAGVPVESLEARESEPVPVSKCVYTQYEVVGHRTFLSQVSDSDDCTDGTCTATMTRSHTYGIDKSVSFDLAAGPISGSLGVSISESWTTGTSNGCNGAKGETVCQWVNIPYLTVRLSKPSTGTLRNPIQCNGPDTTDASYPQGDAARYYCVRGATNCRTNGQGYWA